MNIKVINVYNSAYKKVSIAIMHTLNVMHTKMVNRNNANKSRQLQQYIQSCHLQFFAYNSYRSFDAILRFFLNTLYHQIEIFACIPLSQGNTLIC